MYKVKHKLLPRSVVNIFEENETRYQLHNENDFKMPRFQSVRYGKHSLRYLGPYLWSKISHVDKNSDNLNIFIRNIRGRNLANMLEDNCGNCHLCSF